MSYARIFAFWLAVGLAVGFGLTSVSQLPAFETQSKEKKGD